MEAAVTYEITSVSFGCASTWTVEAKSPAEARRVARAHLKTVCTTGEITGVRKVGDNAR